MAAPFGAIEDRWNSSRCGIIQNPPWVSKEDVNRLEIPDQIVAALERLGPAALGRLAKETQHGHETIARHLDRLRAEGRVMPFIPDNVPAGRISPGRVVWVLIPPDNVKSENRKEKSITFDGEWEPL